MKTRRTFQNPQSDKICRVGLATLIIAVLAFCFTMVTTLPAAQVAYAAEVTQDAAAMARKLQLEGTRLQLQGNLEGAVQKYLESISYKPNPKLEKLVDRLENKVVQVEQAPARTTTPVEQDPAVIVEEQPSSPAPTATVIERAPGTPEKELIYSFTDWALGFFPDRTQSLGLSLETNRNYKITSTGGGQYEVRLDPFIFYMDASDGFNLSPLILNFQPKGKDKLAVQIHMPSKSPFVSNGETVAELTLGSQDTSGVWDRSLHSFDQADMKLGNMTIKDSKNRGQLDIIELVLGNIFTRNELGSWEEKYHGNVKGLSFVKDEEKFFIDSIEALCDLGGSNFSRYAELREKYLSLIGKIEEMEFAETKEFFGYIDEYIQIFSKYTAKLAIRGVGLTADGDTMALDSVEISSGLQKDLQTNKFVFNSQGVVNAFAFFEHESPENPQPVSISLNHFGFHDRGDINPVPPSLFSDLFRAIEGMENVSEKETNAYLGNHAMDFTKKFLRLIAGYSAEISLDGLKVVNAMPNPVTLETAKFGGGFNVGTGEDGRIHSFLSFSGFNGKDMGANNIPQSANLNLELKNIPSVFELITDPSALATGDMQQVQGQIMMNGMNSLMMSALTFSMSDSFIAFPTSRFNLDLIANVDNTAKFFSTGNLKIAIENPDEFMRIAQSFGADPDMQQMLTTITALANRTDANGKVVDSIDAQVNPEGKIIINSKDVTLMFFPEPVEEGAAEGTTGQEF